MSSLQKRIFLDVLAIVLIGSGFLVYRIFAFTEPPSGTTPPANNVPAPINVGSLGQVKVGGLAINQGGADVGLLVLNGKVGVGVTSPQFGVDVKNQVNASGYCINGTNCITQWPTGGSGSIGAFGDYVKISDGSKNFTSSVTQAATDGFLIAFTPAGNKTSCSITVWAGKAQSSLIVVNSAYFDFGTQGCTETTPVPKGYFYKIQVTSQKGSVTVFWMPV